MNWFARQFSWSVISLLALSLLSCRSLDQRFAVKPNALGKTNEITIIADEEIPGSPLWDSLDYYFSSAYPVMPQPEPSFDLRHFTTGQLEADALRRELRTYLVLADIGDAGSPAAQMTIQAIGEEAVDQCRNGAGYGTHLSRDRWAQGQLIFFLYGFGKEKLAEAIRSKYGAIATRIREHDREQLDAATYLNGINGPVIDALRQDLGIGLKIPGEYQVARSEDGVYWLRAEYTESSHNLILSRFDYQAQEQLSKVSIRTWRDSLCREVVRTRTPGSVMYINDQDLPLLFYEGSVNGLYAREMRGVWEMSDDYMGGPFITWLMVSRDQRSVYFIDAWVYAPGKEKRDYMQRLEHIVSSIDYVR